MAGNFWRTFAIVLALVGLLSGCAGAPSPPPSSQGAMAPFPQGRRGPQEVALEQALGEFYGAPYRSGGTTPQGVDCSGLIQAAFAAARVTVPRVVGPQFAASTEVAMSDLRPGDVVFYADMSHVGLYVGDGKVIHAPRPGRTVEVTGLSGYSKAGRYLS